MGDGHSHARHAMNLSEVFVIMGVVFAVIAGIAWKWEKR